MNSRNRFKKNIPISNSMKICPAEAELPHADGQTQNRQMDGQTDMKKLIVAFCNFVNMPRKR
jgi:hypothetical protein